MKEKNIKLIALDLDGTALNKEKKFSRETRQAFAEADKNGINIVIATGRAYNSLPEELFSVKEIKYAVTSNGAVITELKTKKVIYENCLSLSSINQIIKLAEEEYVSAEVCISGKAYIDQKDYDEIMKENRTNRDIDYIKNTRTPVNDIWCFAKTNGSVENICLYYSGDEEKSEWYGKLQQIDNILVTSSFPNNHEIGGATTSKAGALKALMKKLNLDESKLMAVGDSFNDFDMIKLAEVGVVMGNAPEELRNAADYVTDTNANEGVAKAIRKYAL